MFVLSIILIFIGNTMQTSFEPKTYNFAVLLPTSENNTLKGNITELFLEYSFEKEFGTFSFKIISEKSKKIYIHLPKQFNINEINITGFRKNDYYPKCKIESFFEDHQIICPSLPENQTLTFTIYLTNNPNDKFIPNGLFTINNVFPDSYIRYSDKTRSRDLFMFNLGEKYRCSETCFIYEMGSGLIYNSNKNLLRIYDPLNEGDYKYSWGKIEKFNRFYINTYDYRKEKIKGILLSLGISIFAGLLVLIGDFLLENGFSLDNIKKDIKNPKSNNKKIKSSPAKKKK